MRPVLGRHGAVENDESGSIEELRQQRGDVAIADKNLGMSFDLGEVEMWQQVIRPITTASRQDGAKVVALEHLFEFAGATRSRSGEVEIALKNGVQIERPVPGTSESGATGFEIRPLNVAGGRDNSDPIAGAKRGRLHELGIRSWHLSNHNVDRGMISSTKKEFSSAQQLRGTAQENVAVLLADELCSTLSPHFYRRLGAPGSDCGYGGRARSRARRLGLSGATLVKKGVHLVLAANVNELDINPMRELWRALNLGCSRLPSGIKFGNEYDVMRIPQRDRNSSNFAARSLHRHLFFDRRRTHGDFKFVLPVMS